MSSCTNTIGFFLASDIFICADLRTSLRRRGRSAEGEDVRAHAGVEKRDLERARGARAALADELVHPRLGDRAFPGLVDVQAVGVPGRPTVEAYGEADRRARVRRLQDQVDVARLEAIRDRTGGRFERRGFVADRPLAAERPLVERERGGAPAALTAAGAEIGFRRPQGVPVGGLGKAAGVDADSVLVDAQQLLDRSLGFLVGALAEVLEPDTPEAIDDVDGRPVVAVERPPNGEVVVDNDRVLDSEFGGCVAYVVQVVLESELGRVRADDDDAAVAIPLVPRGEVG